LTKQSQIVKIVNNMVLFFVLERINVVLLKSSRSDKIWNTNETALVYFNFIFRG